MTHNCTLVKKFKKIFNYRYPEKIAEVLELLVSMGFYYIELPEILPIDCELFYPKIKNFGQKGDFYFASMGLNFHILPSIIKEKGVLHCLTCVHSIDKQEDIIYIESECIQEKHILRLLNYTYKNGYEMIINEEKTKIAINLGGKYERKDNYGNCFSI